MDGLLNLDKPRGMTSHDVVNRVRRLSDQRRVGHAGTLDPLATGVLIVCLGRATRVAEYLAASPKQYRVTARLGVTTDTYDAEGRVVATAPVHVSRDALESALAALRGTIVQLPPMFSAVKRAGQPLYRLARAGQEVERQPREITITELRLTCWAPPVLTLEMHCSAGTYVRSLVHDLGQALGCGAHVIALVRLASGAFRLEDALSLEALEALGSPAEVETALLPLETALRRFPAFSVDEQTARTIRAGAAFAAPAPAPADVAGQAKEDQSRLFRVYGPDGELLALSSFDFGAALWRPKKVFHPL